MSDAREGGIGSRRATTVAPMTKLEILRYWMSRYGNLSQRSRHRFVRRSEVARLARYPDAIVRTAINWSNLLADALSFAHSAYEGEQQPLPPEPTTPLALKRPMAMAPRRRRDPARDRELSRRIGPVQQYEDSF
jgi:hypothetical protein